MASDEDREGNFICVSLHEATSGAPGFVPLYEERITLIKAASKEQATAKAGARVEQARHTYTNVDGETVTWRCRRVVQVVEMVDEALTDGAELHGRFFRDLAEYERFEAHVMSLR